MGHDKEASDSALRLRALAHPLRWKLMDLVRSEDLATATRCSRVLGESVASCSYHLGILGKYGYLEQVRDLPGREKPWRAIDGWQKLDAPENDFEGQLASKAATEAFLDHEFDRLKLHQRVAGNESEEWRSAGSVAGTWMWVTADELRAIREEMVAILERHGDRVEHPDRRPEAARHARVFFSTSVRPQP